MTTCFELIDNNGNFNRYNPEHARYSFSHARDIILRQVSMLYLSSKSALSLGFSYFLGGGMHHAMSFSGRGFCLVNDIVIVLKKLLDEKAIKHAWVIDLDAHKGDGTAQLTNSDSTITTLSIHMKDGWPLNEGGPTDPWFIPSNIDIEISEGEEGQYLSKLTNGLSDLESNFPRPDIVVVVDGADPYCEDALPSTALLKLSKEQMLERNKLVYHFLKDRNIPQSYCMAGGYGKKSWEIYFQFLHFVGQDSPEWTKVSSR
jgi:acetoin utilization deacetylase AcuC-like enzyme